MATALTRFEIVLPNVDAGTNADTAINTFRHNMEALIASNPNGANKLAMYTAYLYNSDDSIVQQNILYGLLTDPQRATALGYLNTLNAALGSNVLCTINAVTQEP